MNMPTLAEFDPADIPADFLRWSSAAQDTYMTLLRVYKDAKPEELPSREVTAWMHRIVAAIFEQLHAHAEDELSANT
jgi:hypothetical protein